METTTSVEKLLRGLFLDFADEVETTAYNLSQANDIDYVEGDALSKIAEKVGAAQSTTDPELLRVLIKGKIGARSSNGTLKNLDDIFKTMTNGKGYLKEYAPNMVKFFVDENEISFAEVCLEYLRQAKAAGVKIQGIVLENSDTFYLSRSIMKTGGDKLANMES
jgi:hypothetical protein